MRFLFIDLVEHLQAESCPEFSTHVFGPGNLPSVEAWDPAGLQLLYVDAQSSSIRTRPPTVLDVFCPTQERMQNRYWGECWALSTDLSRDLIGSVEGASFRALASEPIQWRDYLVQLDWRSHASFFGGKKQVRDQSSLTQRRRSRGLPVQDWIEVDVPDLREHTISIPLRVEWHSWSGVFDGILRLQQAAPGRGRLTLVFPVKDGPRFPDAREMETGGAVLFRGEDIGLGRLQDFTPDSARR